MFIKTYILVYTKIISYLYIPAEADVVEFEDVGRLVLSVNNSVETCAVESEVVAWLLVADTVGPTVGQAIYIQMNKTKE